MTKKAAVKVAHPWSAKALLAKAQRYAQEMLSYSPDDWRFGLASTFVLEFVARGALAHINPVLLAESKDWHHSYFALGHTPNAAKYTPRSIGIQEVLNRLQNILPAFTVEQKSAAVLHIERRNDELHCGSTPFDGAKPVWLASFYRACKTLLNSMGEDLPLLVGGDGARIAETLIAASLDEAAKAVQKAVEHHKEIWEAKDAAEKRKSSRQASVWATRQTGHRVKCPACRNDALITGTPISEATRRLDGDLIVETQQYLPSKFECIACQLKIAGLSQLAVYELGTPYKSTSTYDAAEYFVPEDPYAGFDDDNNEY